MSLAKMIESLQERIETAPEAVDDPHIKCPNCPLCDGYGNIMDERGGRPCPNALASARKKAINADMAGWEGWPPPTLAQMRGLPGFVETPSFLAVEKVAAELFTGKRPQGLILCGGHGRCKTLAPLALIHECSEKGLTTAAVHYPELIDAYKKGIDGQPFINSTYKRIKAAALVLVDEYGREPQWGNADHTTQAIERIVSLCYRNMYLIITSNLPKNTQYSADKKRVLSLGMDRSLPSDVCSRLGRNSGYCTVIEEPIKADLRGKLWDK